MDKLTKFKIVFVIMLFAFGILMFSFGYYLCASDEAERINNFIETYTRENQYTIEPDYYSYNFSLGDKDAIN